MSLEKLKKKEHYLIHQLDDLGGVAEVLLGLGKVEEHPVRDQHSRHSRLPKGSAGRVLLGLQSGLKVPICIF